jgi:pimeloyl-ACP methyl ester carboxylesterase
LLAYLRDAGYARIVIVAHSQGTVISADLLRYLHAQGRLRGIVGALPVALVTVGSPLRDLYAERFPLLYRWMGSREAGFANAAPAATRTISATMPWRWRSRSSGWSRLIRGCRADPRVMPCTPDRPAARPQAQGGEHADR